MRRVLACCAALFLAGCKCGGPPGALGDVLTSYCKFIDRCPNQVQFPIAYRNQAECVDILNWATTCRISSVDGPTGEPQLTLMQQVPNLDPAAARECQTWLDSASCDTQLTGCDLDSDAGCNPCSRAFAAAGGGGTGGGSAATVDQPCENDSDCQTGLYCLGAKTTADGGQTCRVCKPLRPLGGDCVDPPYVGCGPGLFCQSMSGTCVPLYPAGTMCRSGGECASSFCNGGTMLCDNGGKTSDACAKDTDCRYGFCDPATSKCSDFRANGEPCTVNEQCSYRVCDTATQKCGKADGATCNSSGECQHVCNTTTRLCEAGTPLGGSCTSNDTCASHFCQYQQRVCAVSCSSGCAANQFCDSYGACRDPLSDGSQCQGNEECVSGFCNDNGSCAKRPAIGDPCSGYSDCFPKGLCSGGVCTAYAQPGAACTGIDSCAPPFICTNGKCELMNLSCTPAKAGQQCASLSVCDETSYCDPLMSFTCVAKKNQGDSCNRSVECTSGLFCNRSSRTCSPPVSAGGSCDRGELCAAGLFCDESVNPNKCSAPKPVGATCQNPTDCQSASCEYVSGMGDICTAACLPVPPGDQPACHPAKCADFGFNCGTIDGGCGETVYCGNCSTAYQTCGGGGQTQVCGCTPKRACSARECNTSVDDGCGNRLDCMASCDGGATCGGGSTSGLCGCPSDHVAGPSLPAMAVSVLAPGTSGGFDPWDSVNDVFADDDAGAHVYIDTSSVTTKASQHLLASGFGFNLPPTASVNGISVEIRARASGTSAYIDQVVLYNGTKMVPTSGGGGSIGNLWSTHGAGGSNYLWYWPFTPAEINSPDFGVALAVRSIGPTDAWVDSIKVTVHYAYRCDCRYDCRPDSECGSDGCGGVCGGGTDGGCGRDGGTCNSGYCQPLVFVDSATGLMWTNDSFDVGNCAGLSFGGFTGWRAPTIDELRTRVAGCPATAPGGQCPATTSCTNAGNCLDAGCEGCGYRVGPGLYGCYLDKHLNWISCTGAGPLWSSTVAGTAPYALDFGTGMITLGTGQARYRCVRP